MAKSIRTLSYDFRYCHDRYAPYLKEVFRRLPPHIRSKILATRTFEIVPMDLDYSLGRYFKFSKPVKHLIVLNEQILNFPEIQIIHTIAHEIAHRVIGKGHTGLYEVEADNLLISWGFKREVNECKHVLGDLEWKGYDIGFQWATTHEDYLPRFEQFYNEWNIAGNLSKERWSSLYSIVNPRDIFNEMRPPERIGESISKLCDYDQVKDSYKGNFERAIFWGIMGALKQKKEAIKQVFKGSGKSIYKGVQSLQKIKNEFAKMSTLDCFKRSPRTVKQFKQLIKKVSPQIEFFYKLLSETQTEKKPSKRRHISIEAKAR